jgi:hypothetical protein
MRAEIMSAVADGDDLGMGTLMNEEESFKTKYGQLDGYAYREETDGDPVFGYIGAIDESDHVMIMRTDQCPEEIFFELAAGGSGKDGLLFFPEIRQNLYVLPNESDLDPKLGIYVLEQIGPEYAEERDNVEWAVPIVGNFCSAGSYEVDGALCDVAFFNVVHSDTAQSIHSIFVNDKQSRSVGEPRELENGHAAYLTSDWFSDELSFEHGSYIIAINADTEELSVESMKEIAMDLQIWG